MGRTGPLTSEASFVGSSFATNAACSTAGRERSTFAFIERALRNSTGHARTARQTPPIRARTAVRNTERIEFVHEFCAARRVVTSLEVRGDAARWRYQTCC